jgi:DNA-binding MarR family transcriptional regulator
MPAKQKKPTKKKKIKQSARRDVEASFHNAKAHDLRGGPLDNFIGYRLRLAYNVQVQRFVSVGGAFNIRPPQFAVLTLAYQQPGIKQVDLTNIVNKKHANVVALLDELEQRKLLTRTANSTDKRSRVLYLTDKGRALTAKLIERHKLLDKDLDVTFGVRQRTDLVRLLDAFSRLDPDPDIDRHF